jgi:hypothetical protein
MRTEAGRYGSARLVHASPQLLPMKKALISG